VPSTFLNFFTSPLGARQIN